MTDPLANFTHQLEPLGLRIQQPGADPLFTPTPVPRMRPMHWRWSDLEGLFDQLTAHLSLSPGGGRRTLKLTNPGLPYGTTPTFWASLQYILPGEVATAHRHTPEAFRFVMRGQGCATTVAGQRYPMHQGDLVLTPSWAWHDHVHAGPEPMIWLDVLDISLVRSLDAIFFENYEADVQPVLDVADMGEREFGSGLLRPVGPAQPSSANPVLAYGRAISDGAIDRATGLPPDPRDDVIVEYQNPATGGSAMTTMSIKMQLLRPGFRGQRQRHTGSTLYWVIDGRGFTEIGDEQFQWTAGDFLAVPSWAPYRHCADVGVSARLLRVDDSPALRALGLYREELVDESWTPGR